ncbi:hypothetical protein LCGC14_2664340 [marine sediment metagenome]|uniref:Uncharacterized protein n=1 Tax=marine sediment metagenome TaxID=412755 RepID=A0A0F9CHW5_9ZZZZ
MKIVCAWCDKKMGEKESLTCKDTTWSICPDCVAKVRTSTEVTKEEKEELCQVWAKL